MGVRIRALPTWVKVVVPLVALVAVAVGAFALVSSSDDGAVDSVHAAVRPARVASSTTTSTTTSSTTTSTTITTTLPPPPEETAPPAPPPPPPSTSAPQVSEPPPAPAPEIAPPPAEPEPPPPPPPAPSVRAVTYSIVTDGAVVSDVNEVAAIAAQTYADPRGWAAAGIEFQQVDSGGSFTIVLANAEALPGYAPGVCESMWSCQAGRYVVLNDDRWSQGSPAWPGPLDAYRQMVLNHETGHWLGLAHAFCPGAGAPAPVMQQQSKDMQGCAINSWPLPWELDLVRG